MQWVFFISIYKLAHINIPPNISLCDGFFRWTYQSEEELDGSGHWGLISSYAGGGFVQNLATTKAQSRHTIEVLKQNLWLDRGTRVIFIDFTVYNANINLFCVIRYVVCYQSWKWRPYYVPKYIHYCINGILAEYVKWSLNWSRFFCVTHFSLYDGKITSASHDN